MDFGKHINSEQMAAFHFHYVYWIYRHLNLTMLVLVTILNPLTKSEYTIRNSFQFSAEIQQDLILSMVVHM